MADTPPALSRDQVECIVGFLGYGNPTESVWFVGIEEGLGGATTEDAAKNLNERSSFKEIMDLRDAHHERLRDDCGLINFDAKPPYTPVWQWIAKIMCATNGNDWKNYLKTSLGRINGDTFLTELSPIPAAKTTDKSWSNTFQDLDRNLNEKLEKRRRRLLQLMEEEHPRLVVCYGDGKEKVAQYEKYFGLKWTLIGPRISTGSRRACRFLLLPFFGNGQMSRPALEEMLKLENPPVRAIILDGRIRSA
jgi:hypothetical protein